MGVSTAELQGWIGTIPGPIGERITCQVLAQAVDMPLDQRIAHLTQRLRSSTATGDDRDLVDAILACDPDPGQLEVWRSELGEPSPAPEPAPPGSYPDDWARVWRWSAVLPEALLDDWREPICHVSSTHGEPSKASLDHRPVRFTVTTTVQSPYSTDELGTLPPAEVARRVVAWRPDPQEFFRPVGARELARTVEALVRADLTAWTNDPREILNLLREPVYVLHYLRALTSSTAQLGDRAPAVLAALEHGHTERITPAALGPDDGYSYEPTWDGVDAATVELIKALAEAHGDLHEHIGWAWQQVLAATRDRPDPASGDLLDILGDRDALHSAINRPWGRGLDAAVSLARWEAGNLGPIRPDFPALLDEVIELGGAAGLEFRAVIAARRLTFEALMPAWLDDRADVLFRHDPLGPATLDLTLKWSHPSGWLLDRFTPEIYAAALRGADNALSQLLIATLHQHPGYTVAEVIGQLQHNKDTLRAAAEEVPALLQQTSPDSPTLIVGLDFWRALLDAPGRPSRTPFSKVWAGGYSSTDSTRTSCWPTPIAPSSSPRDGSTTRSRSHNAPARPPRTR